MSKERITLQDIADELHITKGTVDRAVHNRPGISEETRKKVLALIEKYHYKPDRIARSLSLKFKKLRIGVIYEKEFSFFWDNVENGLRAAESELSDFGLEVIYRRMNDERNVEEIIRILDELIAENVDAIALVPINEPQIREKIEEAVKKGIQVATLNDDIVDSKRIFYVGPQIRQSGRTAGELMGRMLGGRGIVFTISYSLHSYEYWERLEGFRTYLRENYKDIELIGDFAYGFRKNNEAGDRLKRILENAGAIDGLYDTTGGYLCEIADIIKDIPQLKNVLLIGHELSDGVRSRIMNGGIAACISQDPYSQGYFVIKMLFDYLSEDKKPQFERMYTRLDIIMKENLSHQGNIINPYYPSHIGHQGKING